MVSDRFVEEVRGALTRIFVDEEELSRLGLTYDIATNWHKWVTEYDAPKMRGVLRKVANDNRISLEQYEAHHDAHGAAVMILATVDGFYRRVLTKPN